MKSAHHWITYCGPWDDTWVKAIQSDARADLECELQEAVELLRPASAPEMYHNKEAEIWARRRDAFLARQKGAQS